MKLHIGKHNVLRKMTSLLMAVLITACALFLAAPDGALAEGEALRVAFFYMKGFYETDAEGKRFGYGVDLLNRITNMTGMRFDYVDAGSSADAYEKLLSGELDMLMPAVCPGAMPEGLTLSSESVLDICYALIALSSRDDLYYDDDDAISGMRIAVTKDIHVLDEVQEFLNAHGVSEGSLSIFDTHDVCVAALEAGEVDAMLSTAGIVTDGMKVLARFAAQPCYIAMHSDDARIAAVDCAMYDIKTRDPGFLASLFEAYYGKSREVALTRDEAEFISGAGEITVGQLPAAAAFSHVDKRTGELVGICEDCLAWIAEETGLKLTVRQLELDERPIEALKSGKVELVQGIVRTEKFESDPELCLSDTFYRDSVTLVAPKSLVYEKDESYSVAVLKSFQVTQEYITRNFPNYTLLYYETDADGIAAVISGEADIAAMSVVVANELLLDPRADELVMLPTQLFETENCFAMRSDTDLRLMAVINKAISAMPSDVLDMIILNNTTQSQSERSLSDTLYKYRVPIMIIAVLLISLVALLFAFLANRQNTIKLIKEKNESLNMALVQANAASAAKGEFLARMSHEIRTPMNAVIGFLTLARNHITDAPRLSHDLEKAESSSRVLLSIINDVLDMSSIEAGKMRISNEKFNLKSLLQSVSQMFYSQCAQKGLRFEMRFPEPVDEMVVGDALRLNQVLLNLVGNAVKFTESGYVRVSVEQKELAGSRLVFSFTIEDTGCGMSEEMQSRMFQPFEQEAVSVEHRHGGSGLGLSIVDNVVKLMKGSIRVESKTDEGTKFVVMLPFGKCEQIENKKIIDWNELRVLVVDDEQSSRDYMSVVLSRIGVEYVCVDSGIAAMDELALACGRGKPYKVCIIDWKMSGMDGFAVTRRIRHEYDRDTVIIVASAYNPSELGVNAMDSGADMFVTKPLFQSSLIDMLSTLTGGHTMQRGDGASAGAADDIDLSGANVLLVEDNETNVLVATELLEMYGINVDTARNGLAGIERFVNSEPGRYDAILMDIQMPVMNGYEATRAIRTSDHAEADTIPIIAMTANAFTEDVTRTLSAGMDDHVAKPIDIDLLLSILYKHIAKNRKRQGRELA